MKIKRDMNWLWAELQDTEVAKNKGGRQVSYLNISRHGYKCICTDSKHIWGTKGHLSFPRHKCGMQCLELPRHGELNSSVCWGRPSVCGGEGSETPGTGKLFRSNATIDRSLPDDMFHDAK